MNEHKDLGDPRSTDIGPLGNAIMMRYPLLSEMRDIKNPSVGEGETPAEREARIRELVQAVCVVPMPDEDEGQCPDCRKFDITHPKVKECLQLKLDHAGGNRSVLINKFIQLGAGCRCPQTRESEDQRRRMQSGLPNHPDRTRSFTNFLTRGSDVLQEARQKALSLTESPSVPVLVLCGRAGIGKSHLLEAACWEALNIGHSARYEMSSRIMDNLRSVYSSNSDETMAWWMNWYSRQWLLAIDDLGLENGTDFVQERLTLIVEDRIQKRMRTIISTNLTKPEVEDRYGARLASRLFSHNDLVEDAEVFYIHGVSDYREQT